MGSQVFSWFRLGQNKPGGILPAHLHRWSSSSGAAPPGSLHKGLGGVLLGAPLFPTCWTESRRGREKTHFFYAAWQYVLIKSDSKEKKIQIHLRGVKLDTKRLERVGKMTENRNVVSSQNQKHNMSEQLLKTSTELDYIQFLIWLQHLLSNYPNHPIACCHSLD